MDADAVGLDSVRTVAHADVYATALPEVVDIFDGDSRPQGVDCHMGADEQVGFAPFEDMPWVALLLLEKLLELEFKW